MIDRHSEHLLTLTEAAHSLPNRPNPSTMWRWWKKGVRGVKLETIPIGWQRYTSKEALDRFFQATNQTGCGEPIKIRTPTQRQRAVTAARRELELAGIRKPAKTA